MRTKDLTKGPIAGTLIVFSIPMIMGNMLQQVYNIADTLVVGRFIGSDALAAVGSVYTLMIFITSLITGLCMGSGALFSADYGAGRKLALKKDIWLSFWFILAVTILIYIIIYPFMVDIAGLLQTPDALMKMTLEYMTIVFSGIIFVFIYNFFAYILRAMGNSVVPLIFLGISSVINIILDVWFVAVMKWGVSGAATATVISQAISGIGIAIFCFFRLPVIKYHKENMTWDAGRFKMIVVNDIATGIQQSVMNFGILMIQGLVNSFGETIMAAFAAAVKIDTLAYMPAQEFGNAYSLFTSQNYGAAKSERIKKGTKMAICTTSVFCIAISIVIFLNAAKLMGVFVKASEAAVIAYGVQYLRIEGACYVGIGILFIWYGYFRGIKKPQIALILTIISLGLRVAISYGMVRLAGAGVTAIWWSIPIGWLLADVTGMWIYKND